MSKVIKVTSHPAVFLDLLYNAELYFVLCPLVTSFALAQLRSAIRPFGPKTVNKNIRRCNCQVTSLTYLFI